jgi:two-component system sensor histidine kinase KdpD
LEFLIQTAGKQLGNIFDGEVVIFVRDDAAGPLDLRFGKETGIASHPVNSVVAQWVADHEQIAGAGTDTLPNATALFAPLIGSQRTVGAVGVRPNDSQRFSDPEQRRLLQACASLIALSFERDQSVLKASEAQLQVQAEQLRNALLSSVSHDLRTPLAAIAGASSTLLEGSPGQSEKTKAELLQTVVYESQRMARLVDNLLDMTKLSSGGVVLNKQWQVLEEIIGSSLARLRRELADHPIHVHIPGDLPLLRLDGVLIEQVFFNLLENACQYSPPGSRIEISAWQQCEHVYISVADNGPGLPAGSESRVFEKFYRGLSPKSGGSHGAGLGLAICQAIVEAHGGHIRASNRPGGGAEFVVQLPCAEQAPRVALDEIEASSSS